MRGRIIKVNGNKGNLLRINDKKIICYFKVVKGLNEELDILKYMLNYIVDNMYNGDIDIKEYMFNSICLESSNVKYILEVIDWYS